MYKISLCLGFENKYLSCINLVRVFIESVQSFLKKKANMKGENEKEKKYFNSSRRGGSVEKCIGTGCSWCSFEVARGTRAEPGHMADTLCVPPEETWQSLDTAACPYSIHINIYVYRYRSERRRRKYKKKSKSNKYPPNIDNMLYTNRKIQSQKSPSLSIFHSRRLLFVLPSTYSVSYRVGLYDRCHSRFTSSFRLRDDATGNRM